MSYNISIALFVYLRDALIFIGTFSYCCCAVRIRTLMVDCKVCGVTGLIEEVLGCTGVLISP
jgi:hypothetical protein